MKFPATIVEFQDQFSSKEACWSYLRQVRWPRGFQCPGRENRRSYFLEPRRLEQCAARRDQASVTAGTIFHRTRLALWVWFVAIFFVARHKQGISAPQLPRDTGVGSYETAWTPLHKVRSALFPDPSRRLVRLVEVDESYVGTPHERGNFANAANYTITVSDGVANALPVPAPGVAALLLPGLGVVFARALRRRRQA